MLLEVRGADIVVGWTQEMLACKNRILQANISWAGQENRRFQPDCEPQKSPRVPRTLEAGRPPNLDHLSGTGRTDWRPLSRQDPPPSLASVRHGPDRAIKVEYYWVEDYWKFEKKTTV